MEKGERKRKVEREGNEVERCWNGTEGRKNRKDSKEIP